MNVKMNRILELEPLLQEIEKLREKGKKIAFTNGVFDILHRGHVDYLAKAKSKADFLIVGLNSDDSVKRLKGESRPIVSELDRAFVLAHLRAVDYVTFFTEDTPINLIEKVKPDVLIKGGDYSLDKIVGRECVENNGGKVLTIPFVSGKSSTNLIEKIKSS